MLAFVRNRVRSTWTAATIAGMRGIAAVVAGMLLFRRTPAECLKGTCLQINALRGTASNTDDERAGS